MWKGLWARLRGATGWIKTEPCFQDSSLELSEPPTHPKVPFGHVNTVKIHQTRTSAFGSGFVVLEYKSLSGRVYSRGQRKILKWQNSTGNDQMCDTIAKKHLAAQEWWNGLTGWGELAYWITIKGSGLIQTYQAPPAGNSWTGEPPSSCCCWSNAPYFFLPYNDGLKIIFMIWWGFDVLGKLADLSLAQRPQLARHGCHPRNGLFPSLFWRHLLWALPFYSSRVNHRNCFEGRKTIRLLLMWQSTFHQRVNTAEYVRWRQEHDRVSASPDGVLQ